METFVVVFPESETGISHLHQGTFLKMYSNLKGSYYLIWTFFSYSLKTLVAGLKLFIYMVY